ncbi:MAG TPA: adenosylmethionine--8-amino-7-oxononanoate transaminase [Candidatus Nitrosotenuis sp.]|nr:adenosylmethionine--8-amino-7-oxononanoate transaminase [Candidatus Nitrosotenuis sp.]HIH46001.1 adenosylmethionine--8-amino-7-oxononanoate transaminase [Candidatus Nitrosotenuis sp.]
MTSSIWHPYTQMSEWSSFPNIVRGQGFWLVDSNGKKYIDGVASMWCNVWGHSNRELISTINRQSKKIIHSSLFNLTNNQAESLAKKLVKISPGMSKVFFSDNGSTAMEIAFKIAIQYWQNINKEKKHMFATLENGYHGDTFGTMSVGFVPTFFAKFKKNMYKTIQIPFQNSYRITNPEDYYIQTLDKVEKELSKNKTISAFVIESGAQVAGGVNIYPEEFQSKISKICKKHDVLFILDEIATGFGRLGSLVEYKTQKSNPDIVAFGKMLTAGYLPMAATLVSEKIYDSFIDKYSNMKHLYHGHTFTGNTLACAVANQNLELYKKTKLISKVRKNAKHLEKRLDEFWGINIVGDIRHKGMLAAIELVSDKIKKKPISFEKSTNKIVFEEAKKHGVYLRTLGNIVMLVPPLAMSENDIDFLIDGTLKTVKKISKKL